MEQNEKREDDYKKSFLVYLDAYRYVLALDMKQRGELFTSLLWYANNAAHREHPMDIVVAGADCTTLTPEGRMAFYFMADAIMRDTVRWNEKHKRYKAAAAKRTAEKQIVPMPFRGRGVDVYPTAEETREL